MAPFIPTRDAEWQKRLSDDQELSVKKLVLFLCEGVTTEHHYFIGLCNNKKKLGIEDVIEVDVIEKTENDRGVSNPKQLIEKAEEIVECRKKDSTYCDGDKIIVVFDTDVIRDEKELSDLLDHINSNEVVVATSYPSFELFLFMHDEVKLDYILDPKKVIEIEENVLDKKGKRPIVTYFEGQFGFNPKQKRNREKLEEISLNISTALKNGAKIDHSAEGKINILHSNVAEKIFQELKFSK